MNILIVDDIYIVRKILKDMIIKEFNFTVFEAESCVDAMSVFKENDIDIVFVDIVMPKIDGIATIKKIREKYLPYIIMCSAIANKETVCESINCGANDYICKPLDEMRIKVAIEKAISNIEEKDFIKSSN